MSGDTLRAKLIAVELGGEITADGSFLYVTHEVAADVALAVFAEWLREQAAELRAEPFDHEPGLVGRASRIMVEQTAKYLENVLADSISTKEQERD